MVPKPLLKRLLNSMQCMGTEWQARQPRQGAAAWELAKEPKLNLSLEMRNRGDVIIVHCEGRIVYGDAVADLSRVVRGVLQFAGSVIVDLTGVSSVDGAGIGELALLHTRAQEKGATLSFAEPNAVVGNLLDLTNLDTVLEIYPSVNAALQSQREEHEVKEQACANC
jgi:anti-anti-sigma factor